MKKIVGRKLGSGEKVNGYGLKFVNNETVIITDNGEEPIIPSSLSIRGVEDIETFEENAIPNENIRELHDKIVETVLSYLNAHNFNFVDEITFSADGLISSIKTNNWIPSTDSSICLYGYEDGKRKIIGYVM